MSLSNYKIGARIMAVVLFISIAMIGVGWYGVYNIDRINAHVDNIYSGQLLPSEYLANASTSFQRARVNLYSAVIETDKTQIHNYQNKSDQYFNDMENDFKQYQGSGLSADEAKQLGDLQSQLSDYKSVSGEILQQKANGGDAAAFAIVRSQANSIGDNIDNAFDNLRSSQLKSAQKSKSDALNDYNRARKVSILVIIIALLISLTSGYQLSRSISKPLGEMASVADDIAKGDLTRNIADNDGKDEISTLSRCIHQMVNNLCDFINHVQDNAHTVASSSQQLTANAQQTSSAATEAASTVTEIAATMDQVAQNAQQVAVLSEDASKQAEQGTKAVDRITSQMDAIDSASSNASQVVNGLSDTLSQVNQIVDLITNIADQTNLLALNAAIEAARAGEQGRGFAVVADEVRKLAEQSAHASKDISQLIVKVLSESKRAVEAMTEGSKQVKEGALVAGEVGVKFQEIIALISRLVEQIQSVAAASEQVSAGVQNVAASTEEQTAAMEEVSNASDQLASMANDLNALVGKYRL